MGYIERSLVPNERVCVRASISWMPVVPTLIGTAIIVVIFWAATTPAFISATGGPSPLGGVVCTVVLLPLFLLPALQVFVRLMTTELAVTDRRVIGKTGWISKKTIEILLTKVESMQVRQGVFGSMFGYGVLQVTGTGGSTTHFPYIKNPAAVRRAAAALADNSQRQPVAQIPPNERTNSAVPSVASQPLFEVQVVDKHSGAERWVAVRAATIDEARSKVAATGEMVGSARLKSFE